MAEIGAKKLGAILAKKVHRGPRWTCTELVDGRLKWSPTLTFHMDAKKRTKAPPTNVDWSPKCTASTANTDGNSEEGDCVIASLSHRIGGWTGNELGIAAQSTDAEALTTYARVCGPGDQGCVITDVLDYATANGIPIGGVIHRLTGYVSVDMTSKSEVQTAIAVFGPAVHIGFSLPRKWYDNANSSGFVWDSLSDRDAQDVVGGHDVCMLGYTPQGVIIATWGLSGIITWAGLGQQGIVTECYCNLSPDWTAVGGASPNGLSIATLTADLALLGQGTLPPLPGPGPTPPPSAGVLLIDTATQTVTLPPGWTLAGGSLAWVPTGEAVGGPWPMSLEVAGLHFSVDCCESTEGGTTIGAASLTPGQWATFLAALLQIILATFFPAAAAAGERAKRLR